jgi:hypothetical protein
MKRTTFFIVFLYIAILTGCSEPSSETPQEPSDINPFVGAWHLTSLIVKAGNGTTSYPFGEQAKGQIVYTPSGRMSAQLMRPDTDVTRFADLDGMSVIQELVQTTFFSYWGTYDVDETAKTVTHNVEGSLETTLVGTAQVRNYHFENEDLLILTASPIEDTEDPTAEVEITWERVQ